MSLADLSLDALSLDALCLAASCLAALWQTIMGIHILAIGHSVGGKSMSILPLASLPIGRAATVRSISPDAPSYRRILNLGFVGGTKVKAVRSSPLGDPRAYLVRGTVVALRREDAQAILVEVTDE